MLQRSHVRLRRRSMRMRSNTPYSVKRQYGLKILPVTNNCMRTNLDLFPPTNFFHVTRIQPGHHQNELREFVYISGAAFTTETGRFFVSIIPRYRFQFKHRFQLSGRSCAHCTRLHLYLNQAPELIARNIGNHYISIGSKHEFCRATPIEPHWQEI